ncbi:glycoside hydrolase family 93 protein [Bipolaris sorokiniana ND90Pr]|uniref:Glycoside hydrolase family 93 protein n=1 Tax=Cochliobolus sativus (strain ND90Pr / ATCC 201652) TaxID=665912 RepID=M2RBH7_COCSN|nr:glycoside hydrolase family 93 protein [Bipolaris sorokiniana ND90Pr]EMD64189.1 glycoside hydrolase family 93 protein [Bipolaris sorokiniana ND90Pr]
MKLYMDILAMVAISASTIVGFDPSNSQVFTNTQGGAVDEWEKHATPAGSAYSHPIQILKNRPEHLMIYGGESWNGFLNGGKRPIVATVVNLTEVLSAPAS